MPGRRGEKVAPDVEPLVHRVGDVQIVDYQCIGHRRSHTREWRGGHRPLVIRWAAAGVAMSD